MASSIIGSDHHDHDDADHPSSISSDEDEDIFASVTSAAPSTTVNHIHTSHNTSSATTISAATAISLSHVHNPPASQLGQKGRSFSTPSELSKLNQQQYERSFAGAVAAPTSSSSSSSSSSSRHPSHHTTSTTSRAVDAAIAASSHGHRRRYSTKTPPLGPSPTPTSAAISQQTRPSSASATATASAPSSVASSPAFRGLPPPQLSTSTTTTNSSSSHGRSLQTPPSLARPRSMSTAGAHDPRMPRGPTDWMVSTKPNATARINVEYVRQQTDKMYGNAQRIHALSIKKTEYFREAHSRLEQTHKELNAQTTTVEELLNSARERHAYMYSTFTEAVEKPHSLAVQSLHDTLDDLKRKTLHVSLATEESTTLFDHVDTHSVDNLQSQATNHIAVLHDLANMSSSILEPLEARMAGIASSCPHLGSSSSALRSIEDKIAQQQQLLTTMKSCYTQLTRACDRFSMMQQSSMDEPAMRRVIADLESLRRSHNWLLSVGREIETAAKQHGVTYRATVKYFTSLEEFGKDLQTAVTELDQLACKFHQHHVVYHEVVTEIVNLGAWYRQFLKAYDELLKEIYRRREHMRQLKTLVEKLQAHMDSIAESEAKVRGSFYHEYGRYLPPALCPAIAQESVHTFQLVGQTGTSLPEITLSDLQQLGLITNSQIVDAFHNQVPIPHLSSTSSSATVDGDDDEHTTTAAAAAAVDGMRATNTTDLASSDDSLVLVPSPAPQQQ
jgi:Autophagy protein ATG17-like domain